MKRKELKNLAKKIAKLEMIIQNSSDSNEIRKAQDAMLELSGQVNNFTDMMELDELVQEYMETSS